MLKSTPHDNGKGVNRNFWPKVYSGDMLRHEEA